MYISTYHIIYEWRRKLLATRNGHGQSGWSSFASEGFNIKLNIKSTHIYIYIYVYTHIHAAYTYVNVCFFSEAHKIITK